MERITVQQQTEEFQEGLRQLLRRFGAPGWPVTIEVEDDRMAVWIPGQWDEDGNVIREATEIDLGGFVVGDE